MIIPSIPSTGIRSEIRELLDCIAKHKYELASSHLDEIESMVSSYFSSRGEIRKDVMEDIKYIRGDLNYEMREKAIEKVANLVQDLKRYKKDNPREKMREIRMEIEQAFSDLSSGEIERDECVSIVREALENLEDLEESFKSLDDGNYEGIYQQYVKSMESAGQVRSQLFNIIDTIESSNISGRDFSSLENFQTTLEDVIHYDPEKISMEKEEEEEMTPESKLISAIQGMMQRGKQQQMQELMNKVEKMIEGESEEKADTGKIPDDIKSSDLFGE